MRSLNLRYLILLAVVLLTAQSCKKDEKKQEGKAGSYKNIALVDDWLPAPGVTNPSKKTKPDFVPAGSIWNKQNLTVGFLNGPHNMDATAAHQAVINGMLQWLYNNNNDNPMPTSLPIVPYNQADIKVAWYTGDHGDGHPFDGQYGVLAHAFFPSNGQLHFDDSEDWTLSLYGYNPLQIDLQSVATHEFGHILGLDHSECTRATMTPIYFGLDMRMIDLDDFMGFHSIYNKPPVQQDAVIGNWDMPANQDLQYVVYWEYVFNLWPMGPQQAPTPYRFANIVWTTPPGVDIISGQGTTKVTVRANGSYTGTGKIQAHMTSCNVSLDYYSHELTIHN